MREAKWLAIIALLTVVLALTFFVGKASADGLGGSWSGHVTQSNNNESYDVEMELYGTNGSIKYPTLHCGGTLSLISANGGTYSYREHITFGTNKCYDGGTIRMNLVNPNDPTRWDWVWQGNGISVSGILNGSGTGR
jgi:hypothetical protein